MEENKFVKKAPDVDHPLLAGFIAGLRTRRTQTPAGLPRFHKLHSPAPPLGRIGISGKYD